DREEDRHQRESTARAAQATAANRQYVTDAKKIKQRDEELFGQVKQGALGITDAQQLLKLAESAPDLVEAVKEQIQTIHQEKAPEAARKAVHAAIQEAVREQKRR